MAMTQSAAVDIQLRIDEMFQADKTQAANEFMRPAASAKTVLESLTHRSVPVMRNGKCVGLQVLWLKDCNDDAVVDTTAPDVDCDIPSGSELSSDARTYEPDLFINDTRSASDDLCGNYYEFVDTSAMTLKRLITTVEQKLNAQTVAFLKANAQVNGDTGGSGIITGTETGFPAADFGPDLLAEISAYAATNRIGDYRILSGRNFYNSVFNANYKRLNDNGRSEGAAFDNAGIAFDLLDLDTAAAVPSTFVFNPDGIGFFNKTWSGYTPELVDPQLNKWAYKISSPSLRYRYSASENGRLITRLQPVEYEVEYQKVCTGRDSLGKPVYSHTYLVRFIGSLFTAPNGCNDETGILHFTKIVD